MTVEVRRLSEALGAEVIGIDVTKPLAEAELAAVEQAFLEFGVLLFRQQPMTPQQLVAFGRQFGVLQPHVQRAYQHPEAPEIVMMTNRKADGSFDEVGARRGAIENLRDGWHSDLSYDPQPAKATLLHSVEATTSGGHTCFTNVATAFERMPDDLKRRVIGLKAEFPYGGHGRNKSTAMAASALDKVAQESATAVHPVINVHPVSRKPAIYVNPLMTSRILDISSAESEELLEQLFDWIDWPEFRWEHRWTVGDTLMWENRGGIMHCGRLDYPRGEPRRFIRTTVRGGPTEPYIPA